jgi:hypothetical protein
VVIKYEGQATSEWQEIVASLEATSGGGNNENSDLGQLYMKMQCVYVQRRTEYQLYAAPFSSERAKL